jgi:hypothetical protein
MMKTVQQELKRRRDCRYGLYGVRVALRECGEEVFAILGSHWDKDGELRLSVCSVPDFEALKAKQAAEIKAAGGPLIKKMSELSAEPVAPSEIRGVPAADCFLLTDWPIR